MRRVPTFTIYTLRDETGAVRYVGCTSQRPSIRFQGHKSAKTHVGNWLRSEIHAGRTVEMVIEEQHKDKSVSFHKASMIEKSYINGYRRLLGEFLLNRDGPRVNKKMTIRHAVPTASAGELSPLEKRRSLNRIA